MYSTKFTVEEVSLDMVNHTAALEILAIRGNVSLTFQVSISQDDEAKFCRAHDALNEAEGIWGRGPHGCNR
jgi:hypothetical protein